MILLLVFTSILFVILKKDNHELGNGTETSTKTFGTETSTETFGVVCIQ